MIRNCSNCEEIIKNRFCSSKHTEKVLKAWCLKIPNLKAQLSAGKEFCLMFGVIVSTTDSCPRHRFIDELAGREDRTPSYGNKLGPCLVLE